MGRRGVERRYKAGLSRGNCPSSRLPVGEGRRRRHGTKTLCQGDGLEAGVFSEKIRPGRPPGGGSTVAAGRVRRPLVMYFKSL